MRKLKFFIAALALCACCMTGGAVRASAAEKDLYYLGGMTAGFLLSAGGVQVIGLNEVAAEYPQVEVKTIAGITAASSGAALLGAPFFAFLLKSKGLGNG